MATPWIAEPMWRGETVAILCSGPSLKQQDIDLVRGRCRVIAINDTYRLAPWADILYACDSRWWDCNPQALNFAGLKICLDDCTTYPVVRIMKRSGHTGFDDDPGTLRTGSNSGYQATHLAAHLGATRIILLGADMRSIGRGRSHFFGDHAPPLRNDSPYEAFVQNFRTLAPELVKRGISVVNCTPGSALDCFPIMALADALGGQDGHNSRHE